MTSARLSALLGLLATAAALASAPAVAQPARGVVPQVLHERLPAAVVHRERYGEGGDADDAPEAAARAGSEEAVAAGEGDAPGGFSVDAVPRLSPPGAVGLDGETGRDEVLTYFAVFDPSVIPFKRSYIRDRVQEDGSLTVGESEQRPFEVDGEAGTAPGKGAELFWGSLLVELAEGRPVPIPTVAPESRILEVTTSPPVELQLLRDGADNLYLQSGATGRVRLNMLMDAPGAYFGADPPATPLGPPEESSVAATLPPAFRRAGIGVYREVRRSLGKSPGAALRALSFAEVTEDLVLHFRAFEPGGLPQVPLDPVARYETIALGRRGVCRHRAYAFVVTAQALGVRARYVANEAHAFVEVRFPGPEGPWRRIDLGGGAAGLDVRGGAHRARHAPGGDDRLPRPSTYRAAYSARASGPAEAARGDDLVGLPREAAPRGGVRGASAPGLGEDGATPGPGRGDRRHSTTLALKESVAYVFRGEDVKVEGRMRRAGGRSGVGGSGLFVEVSLVDAVTGQVVARLGQVPLASDGQFRAGLRVPPGVAPGRYWLRAAFPGNRSLAPSRSR